MGAPPRYDMCSGRAHERGDSAPLRTARWAQGTQAYLYKGLSKTRFHGTRPDRTRKNQNFVDFALRLLVRFYAFTGLGLRDQSAIGQSLSPMSYMLLVVGYDVCEPDVIFAAVEARVGPEIHRARTKPESSQRQILKQPKVEG